MANYRIFLSHSHRDNDFCRRVVEHIQHALPDTDVFYDEHTIIGGDEWMRRVQREVIERPIFIVILSPNSVESEWVREETNLALSEAVIRRERRIIPIRYQECDVVLLAALLLNRQIVDCVSQDESTGLRQLVDAIQRCSSPERPPIVEQTLHRAYELSTQIHIAYRDERWEDVIRLGRVALQLQGNECDGDTLGEVGIALIRHGNIDEGRCTLDAALQIQALRPDFWLARARMLSQHGEQVDAALASLDAALVVTQDVAGKVAILQEELALLTRASRRVESLTVIDEMLRLTPHNATLWTSRADALARLGRTHEALAAYDRALALNPNDEVSWSARARALIVLGEFEDAVAATHRALALVPHDTSMWLTKAEALCAMGKYDEALAIYDRALAVAPRDMNALLAKGNALAHLQRWHEVVWLCDNALAHLPPVQSDLLLLKAQALIALGDAVSALGVFDHAARTGQPTAAVLTARGNVLMRLGRHGEALTVYNQAIQMNPAVPAIWYQKALALFHLSRLPEAHSACDKALQLDGNNSLLWSAKGAMLYWSRRYAEALHVYDQALRLNTTNLHALTGRAMALWAQRRYVESLAACDYVLTICPSDSDALRTRQFALFALGRTHEAEQMIPGTSTSISTPTPQPLGQRVAGG